MNTLKTLTAAAALLMTTGAARAECHNYIDAAGKTQQSCSNQAPAVGDPGVGAIARRGGPQVTTLMGGIQIDLAAASRNARSSTRPHFYKNDEPQPDAVPVVPIVSDAGFPYLVNAIVMKNNQSKIDCRILGGIQIEGAAVGCQPFDAQKYFENLFEAAVNIDQPRKNCFFKVLAGRVNGQIFSLCKVPALMETDAAIYIEALQLVGVR